MQRDSNKGLSQIPYTVKKQKPAQLRRDYWAPLCLIEVPKGLGVVGRNVMQKLREFRRRHELEWGWQAEELLSRSRRERGELIHNQRSNAVADIAAVLAGAGRGNRMWTAETAAAAEAEAEAETAASEEAEAAESQPAGAAAPENIDETTAAADGSSKKSKSKAKAKSKAVEETAPKTLVKANIYWANDLDQHWASEWTENVTHSVGLPEHIENPRFKTSYLLEAQWEEPEPEAEPEAEAKEASDAQETAVEPDAAAEKEEKPQPKKGWMGWLGGKGGSSSQENRV